MKPSASRRISRIREAFSWRSPMVVALLIARELLRPLLYWHAWHIFETDLSKPIPQGYGKEELRVCFYPNAGAVTPAEGIAAMGELKLEEVERRLARGDSVMIGYVRNKQNRDAGGVGDGQDGERPAGYIWIGQRDGLELVFDTHWIVRPGEAVKYGSFVHPAFRGRGIHSSLNFAVNCGLRERGIRKAVASISLLNPQSMSMPKHYKKAIAMTIFVARIRGLNWTLRKASGAPLGSRFTWKQK